MSVKRSAGPQHIFVCQEWNMADDICISAWHLHVSARLDNFMHDKCPAELIQSLCSAMAYDKNMPHQSQGPEFYYADDGRCVLIKPGLILGLHPANKIRYLSPMYTIIALWGWFNRDVLPVMCCEHGPPGIATVHFSKFSIATNIFST